MFLKKISASLNVSVVLFENVHSGTKKFKASRFSVIFRNVIFGFHQRVLTSLNNRFLINALTYYLELAPLE